MRKWAHFAVVAMVAITTSPAHALDLSSLAGTADVQFNPMQHAGILNGCALSYRISIQDHAYRQGKLIGVVGNIIYATSNKKTGGAGILGLKILTQDILDSDAKPEPPFFAYIETPHGTTARSNFTQAELDTPGARHFAYQLDEQTTNVLTDILSGASVTIGFNRVKDGLDILAPLDLQVADSTTTDTGIKRHRSPEMLRKFSSCVLKIAKSAKERLGVK